ncbi:MAG: amidohydrolase [Bacillota bacterium]|jgi:predicted amidohydrolase YtcJ
MKSICAEKVLLSKNIFTAENHNLISGGIAVAGYHIIAVGSRKEIERYIGDKTVVYDFGDKLLMPGFCDSHVHLMMGCMATAYPDLGKAKSADECGRILREYYDKDPGFFSAGEWILGFNWYHTRWEDKSYPTKEVLDRYFPDLPVFLMNADCHGAWVNSKALEVCGVDKNTPEVPYGRIHRDAAGNPTGYLEEMATKLCINEAYDLPNVKEKMLLQKVNKFFSRYGITSVGDMQYILGADVGKVQVYRSMADGDELDFRINFANGLFDDMERILFLHNNFNNKEDLVYYNGLKEFVDGIISTHTSVMLDKYTDDPAAPVNYELMDLKKAEELIGFYHSMGMNIQLHATGDGAVKKALDMYEKAIKANGKTKSRLSIEHLDLTDPADWKRLGRLGVIASVQPPHITLSDSLETNDYPPVIGEERCKRLWAYKSFADNGAVLAFGTDYPVVYDSPMVSLHRAVTRKFPNGKPVNGWNPQQRLSVADAVIAYTLGGAKKFGKEDVLGTISVGKLADITVVDKNLLKIAPDEILDANVVFTMVDGRVVYDR